jgi:hypothetical protein
VRSAQNVSFNIQPGEERLLEGLGFKRDNIKMDFRDNESKSVHFIYLFRLWPL